MFKRAFNKIRPWLVRIVVIESVTLAVLFGWVYTTRRTMLMSDEKAVSYIESMNKEDRVAYITRMPNKEGDRLIRLHIAYKLAELESHTPFPERTGN